MAVAHGACSAGGTIGYHVDFATRGVPFEMRSPLSASRWLASPGLAIGTVFFIAVALAGPVAAPVVSEVQVRVVTGGEELTAGSLVELRIYEEGKSVRRLPITHGESWPRDSTLVIPVKLTEPLDPRSVLRFGLYYRAASPLTPPWEVVSAEVDLASGRAAPQRLLDASLFGTISRQGELATEEREPRSMACVSDADCDDHRRCNGQERCAPQSAGADARGCVKGAPVVCPVNQVCTEQRGCRGLYTAPAAASAPTDASAPGH